MAFCVWLPSLEALFSRFIPGVAWTSVSLLSMSDSFSMRGYSSIHQLMAMGVIPAFFFFFFCYYE